MPSPAMGSRRAETLHHGTPHLRKEDSTSFQRENIGSCAKVRGQSGFDVSMAMLEAVEQWNECPSTICRKMLPNLKCYIQQISIWVSGKSNACSNVGRASNMPPVSTSSGSSWSTCPTQIWELVDVTCTKNTDGDRGPSMTGVHLMVMAAIQGQQASGHSLRAVIPQKDVPAIIPSSWSEGGRPAEWPRLLSVPDLVSL